MQDVAELMGKIRDAKEVAEERMADAVNRRDQVNADMWLQFLVVYSFLQEIGAYITSNPTRH